MSRAYCPTPDRCTAPKRGVCPCQVDAIAKMSASLKAAWADPEVKARHAAAWADPEVKARRAAAMADPEVKARHAAGVKAAMAGRALVVPAHLKAYAAKLRRCGIRGDALRRAIEAAS